jgi:hypothetical protein
MRIRVLTCAVALLAVPASAQETALRIDLIPGHPIYQEERNEAGVAMALSITPGGNHATNLMALCEELRIAAGLGNTHGDKLRLEVIFVVPRKDMAVEGYYLPSDDTLASDALLRGKGVPRPTLDRIVAQAGIPPRVLDETKVEHEVSCEPREPVWSITWTDVRRVGDEQPQAVIEVAGQRFLAVHRSVVEHNTIGAPLQEAKRTSKGG